MILIILVGVLIIATVYIYTKEDVNTNSINMIEKPKKIKRTAGKRVPKKLSTKDKLEIEARQTIVIKLLNQVRGDRSIYELALVVGLSSNTVSRLYTREVKNLSRLDYYILELRRIKKERIA